MRGLIGTDLMNSDLKDKQVARCATCGRIHGLEDSSPRCRNCGGPIIHLGPINWTFEDQVHADIDLQAGIVEDPIEARELLEDHIDVLWIKVDQLEAENDELEGTVSDLEDENAELGNSIIEKDKEIKALETQVAKYVGSLRIPA